MGEDGAGVVEEVVDENVDEMLEEEHRSSSSPEPAKEAAAAAEEEEEDPLTEEEKQERIEKAEALKKEGNVLFVEADYENALGKYVEALETSPSGSHERSTYHCNAAACHIKLEDFDSARESCSKALEIKEDYLKALMRRCLAYEKLDGLLSPEDRKTKVEYIENAAKDAKAWVDLEPNNAEAKATHARLEGMAAKRREELKDEVMGKLKDLGNSILGKFGLSLDNFNAEKDPNTGSYSVNFKK
mmetsp:Transcript_7278/g.18654  ORF Transcript_7278/g.18654 Transcript_7278/m.18654 type:complete len:244 (+) Transcript_7278:206-937(+)|eukprot:CAMPEP_0198235690 /NCGR_PEP_ID=MMETSP1446-20131203/1575_1 /TAXON_ID=1461542 ORGANISM="Unidentified sp, Strain CCMP2111" /NCGR_SAMPLE_ID=MMETSP1446 /ASSEMBLY_ACC=CAM_ASM_001112 /LENGTH=243 /DNA_ID=CAMNT_0043917007 /DNA_START=223 /DNA_END=954 /DNA_ORIENTATION=+